MTTLRDPENIHLNVSETFGPTIQGEGRHAGALASFVRLAGCNLTCSWCDSAYTWDWATYDHAAEVQRVGVESLAETVAALPGRIVVTGGEPLLQSLGLGYLMRLVRTRRPDARFDLETNGTRPLGATAGMWDTITCSPKIIPSADQGTLARRLNPGVLAAADLKFVVRDHDDLHAVDALLDDGALAAVPRERVWLMPEGTDADTLTSRTPWLAERCVERGVNFTSRLHVYAWHDTRGH